VIQYLASNLTVLSAEVALPEKGVSSYKEMVEFVQYTLNERTDVHDDISSAQLAHAIVESILNRMRVTF
jgi:hypothetical protein